MATLNILVVDDEATIIDLLLRILGKEPSFRVSTASNGFQALNLARHERFDVILCDIMMPDVSGTELIQEMTLKKICPPYVIYMSGAIKPATRFNENIMFIRKPFNPSEIMASLLQIARRKKH